jgi:hypothetical protein
VLALGSLQFFIRGAVIKGESDRLQHSGDRIPRESRLRKSGPIVVEGLDLLDHAAPRDALPWHFLTAFCLKISSMLIDSTG